MEIDVSIGRDVIEAGWVSPEVDHRCGASVEFRGIVRDEERGASIAALIYEAYEAMAVRVMRRILEEESARHPCERVVVRHRHGRIAVGETAVLVWIAARHRGEAFALLAAFMDRLKREAPIWKVGAEPA